MNDQRERNGAIACGELLLPRPVEQLVSDIHGESEAFRHLLVSRSGQVRSVAEEVLLGKPYTAEQVARICAYAYYPEEMLARADERDLADSSWWLGIIGPLARMFHHVAAVRSERDVRGAYAAAVAPLGPGARPTLAALRTLAAWATDGRTCDALGEAVAQAMSRGEARGVLCALASSVRSLCVGALHFVGDIWDRGPRGDEVVADLMSYPHVDVQWGNHDVCWMGAAAGDPVCIATCLRNNIKYGNIEQFENGYGISLAPLVDYAERVYADDGTLPPVMKAVSALLFKCEGQAILRHPEWGMQDRLLWGRMDLSGGTVEVGGVAYPLRTLDFPTFSKEDPYALDADERELVEGFAAGFRSSARLQAHVRWLFERGSVYKTLPGLLLFHGCVPLNDDGTFAEVDCGTGRYAGKRLLDWTDALCRYAWSGRDQWALDWMGYLWCGWQSTFAGRVVKTFERTYIADESTWKEPEDPYYALTREDPAPCEAILAEFGLDPACSRIVNGHTPVKLPKGESPVRGAGKRLVIDGGFCRAYRSKTGIAGYTLNVGAEGLSLVEHGEFPGKEAVLRDFADTGHGVALEL